MLNLKLQGRATSEKRRNDIGQLCDRLMKVTSDYDWTQPIYGREIHTIPTSMHICNLTQLAKDVEPPLIEALHECRQTSVLLNGVSFDVQATIPPQDCDCSSPHFVIRPIIDDDRLQMRLEAATNLVKSNCAKLQYTMAEPVTLPITRLLGNVQDQIESISGLEGALILDAALDKVDRTTESNKQVLQIGLIGRVADPGQNMRIAQLCQKVIDAHECIPSGPKECGIHATGITLSPSAKTLLVEPYSQSAAARFFDDGLEYFMHHRYRKAHRAFRLAYAHSPANVEYQYWLVLCELELRQSDRAYRRLKPLVWKIRGPNGSENDYKRVLFSLERVQGCVRQRLVGMEDHALAELPPTLR